MPLVQLYVPNVAANATVDMMLDAATGASNVRFVKRPSRCVLAIDADAVGMEYRVMAGSRTVIDRSTLDAGGTDAVFPNLNEKAVTFFAAGGEIISIEVREIAGTATTDVMATLSVEPG